MASRQGLRPLKQNPRLGRGIIILKEKWGYDSAILENNAVSAVVDKALLPEINKSFINSGLELTFSFTQKKSLEDLFLDLTEGDEIV